MTYHYRHFYIPTRMMPALEAWVKEGRLPGDFLCAVLENDLMNAVALADDENLANLPAFCVWLYNEAPSRCYGGKAEVTVWAAEHEARRQVAAQKTATDETYLAVGDPMNPESPP